MNRLLATTLALLPLFAPAEIAGFMSDFAAAREEAAKSGRNILALFVDDDCREWFEPPEEDDGGGGFAIADPRFAEAAKSDFVLALVDGSKEENREIVEKHEVGSFPAVKIVGAEGEGITGCLWPECGISPEEYAERLRKAAKNAPAVAKHIEPYRKELENLLAGIYAKTAQARQTGAATDEEKEKAAYEAARNFAAETLPAIEALRERAAAEEIPDEIKEDMAEFLSGADSVVSLVKTTLETPWEDYLRQREEICRYKPKHTAFAFPGPEAAKTDRDYYIDVAIPFYTRNIVDTYDAAAESDPQTREDTLAVRKAVVRKYAFSTPFFPYDSEMAAAERLWNRGSRDAAAAIVRFDGMSSDDQYWQGESMFAEATAALDSSKDPLLGYLLAGKAYKNISRWHDSYPDLKPKELVKIAYAAFSAAFENALPVFREADQGIIERLDIFSSMPFDAGVKLGNVYLDRCKKAAACKSDAFAARGTGWASEVTAEGWEGWNASNETAEKELLAAYEQCPGKARAPMMLADLYGRSCASGDPIEWLNRGVSNSLDIAAQLVGSSLLFQTARWGGGSDVLREAAMLAATNVVTASAFSYTTCASAIRDMIEYDNEGDNRGEVYKRVIDPELRAAVFGMFDAYIAAGDEPGRASADEIRQMALTFALVLGEWDKAREYRSAQTKKIGDLKAQYWAEHGLAREELIFYFSLAVSVSLRDDGLEIIDVEQAFAEGRYAEAAGFYGKMRRERLSLYEQQLADMRSYVSRLRANQQSGGPVDLMPIANGRESVGFWGAIGTCEDGWARLLWDWRGYKLSLVSVPALGSEFEAEIAFEPQEGRTDWHIGWGMARPFTCNSSGWAYPAVFFSRDANGDHVRIEAVTVETEKLPKTSSPENKNFGLWDSFKVYEGDLERKDTHTFRLAFGDANNMVSVDVDGEKIYEIPVSDIMHAEGMAYRLQPNGEAFPVWKLFEATAFRNYRYRRIAAPAAEN